VRQYVRLPLAFDLRQRAVGRAAPDPYKVAKNLD
jgi:hypothetical protein